MSSRSPSPRLPLRLLAAVIAVGAALPAAPGQAADGEPSNGPEPCIVAVRLVAISCVRAGDNPDSSDDKEPKGEYHLRVDADAEIGPFELRAGESSSFNPGLLLKTIDTGIARPSDGSEVAAPISFRIAVREDDSTPTGEDDQDDHSVPLVVNERVTCPGSTTSMVRLVEIPQVSDGSKRRKPDLLKLSLKIFSEK